MSENKYEELILPNEQRHVIVGGKRYYGKTGNMCTSCSTDDRNLYLKTKHGESCTLECPACDLVVHLPIAQIRVIA